GSGPTARSRRWHRCGIRAPSPRRTRPAKASPREEQNRGPVRMRTLALLLTICFLPACNITWKGQGSGLTSEQRQADIKDVDSLASAYETNQYFKDLRRRQMGRSNAFGRDLRSIGVTIDRHFFNYSETDPY